MKILFLGVGAGEFYPAMLCNCPLCTKYRNEGKILGFSSVLIDDQFLFDIPPGTNLNFAEFKVKAKFPFHIFVTHSHQDHFDPVETISPRDNVKDKVFIHINKTISDLLEHYQKFNRFYNTSSLSLKNIFVKIIKAFKKIPVNDGDFVIPILANHDKFYDEKSMNYIIKIKDKTVLYASDTGWYDNDETWNEILKHKYNVLILEFSFTPIKGMHLDYEHFMKFIEHLKENKCIDSNTQIIATHLHLHRLDPKQIELLEKAGVKIAFRGMECEC